MPDISKDDRKPEGKNQ